MATVNIPFHQAAAMIEEAKSTSYKLGYEVGYIDGLYRAIEIATNKTNLHKDLDQPVAVVNTVDNSEGGSFDSI